MRIEILQGEKEWNNLKNEYKNVPSFSLMKEFTFEVEREDGNVLRYELEKNLPEKMNKICPKYTFSCVKHVLGKVEWYNLYFENEKYIKKISCLYRIHFIDLTIYSFPREGYLKTKERLPSTEEDKKIADLFYKEVTAQNHLRLRVLTNKIKRNNRYKQ